MKRAKKNGIEKRQHREKKMIIPILQRCWNEQLLCDGKLSWCTCTAHADARHPVPCVHSNSPVYYARNIVDKLNLCMLHFKFGWCIRAEDYLLQNASHIPLALTGLKFFASLTSTCNDPFDDDDDDELREPLDDLMLPPNLRKPLLIDDLEKCDDFESGGTNFKPTIMSPRYVERSSNGSLYEMKNILSQEKKKQEKKKQKEKKTRTKKRKKNRRHKKG